MMLVYMCVKVVDKVNGVVEEGTEMVVQVATSIDLNIYQCQFTLLHCDTMSACYRSGMLYTNIGVGLCHMVPD